MATGGDVRSSRRTGRTPLVAGLLALGAAILLSVYATLTLREAAELRSGQDLPPLQRQQRQIIDAFHEVYYYYCVISGARPIRTMDRTGEQ